VGRLFLEEGTAMIVTGGKLWMKRCIWACVLTAGLAVAACSSGGSGSDATPGSMGQAVVSLTDAAGDFLSYTVDVESLRR